MSSLAAWLISGGAFGLLLWRACKSTPHDLVSQHHQQRDAMRRMHERVIDEQHQQ